MKETPGEFEDLLDDLVVGDIPFVDDLPEGFPLIGIQGVEHAEHAGLLLGHFVTH